RSSGGDENRTRGRFRPREVRGRRSGACARGVREVCRPCVVLGCVAQNPAVRGGRCGGGAVAGSAVRFLASTGALRPPARESFALPVDEGRTARTRLAVPASVASGSTE